MLLKGFGFSELGGGCGGERDECERVREGCVADKCRFSDLKGFVFDGGEVAAVSEAECLSVLDSAGDRRGGGSGTEFLGGEGIITELGEDCTKTTCLNSNHNKALNLSASEDSCHRTSLTPV